MTHFTRLAMVILVSSVIGIVTLACGKPPAQSSTPTYTPLVTTVYITATPEPVTPTLEAAVDATPTAAAYATPTPTPRCVPGPVASPKPTDKKLTLVGHLGGVIQMLTIQGHYAYAGGDYGFNVLDLSEPKRPIQVGYLAMATMDIAVHSNTAFLAAGENGLYVVDVSDPSTLTEIGNYQFPSMVRYLAIASRGNNTQPYLFVGTDDGSITIFDMANPAKLEKMGTYHSEGVGGMRLSTYLSPDGRLYGFWQTTDSLQILDVSDPAHVVKMGDVEGTSTTDWNHQLLTIIDHYLYLQSGAVKDISDPATPKPVGNFPSGWNAPDGWVWAYWRAANYLYLIISKGSLDVLDVSHPAEPVLVNSLEVGFDYYNSDWTSALAAAGNYLYVSNESGVKIFDISDPRNPALAGVYDNLTASNSVKIQGDSAFLARGMSFNSQSYWGGFSRVNISNPNRPIQTDFMTLDESACNMALANDYAYLGRGHCSAGAVSCWGGVSIFNLSNGLLTRMEDYDVPDPTDLWGRADWHTTDVTVKDNSVYLAGLSTSGEVGVRILRVDNYIQLTETAVITKGLGVQRWDPFGLAVVDTPQARLGYMADEWYGLRIIDLDPSSLREVGSYPISKARWVTVVGHYAYVASDTSLVTVDVSDPAAPRPISGFCTPGEMWHVRVSGSLAYLADMEGGVRILDVADPAAPIEIASYATLGRARDVAVVGQYIYVAEEDGGLAILRYH